jgi:hypothetical protein
VVPTSPANGSDAAARTPPRRWARGSSQWLCATLLAASSSVAGLEACGGGHVMTCGQIPTGGCPIGRGGTCDDSACNGLYDCVEGTWLLLTRCPGGDGGGGSSAGGMGGVAGAAGSGAQGGGGGCVGVTLDHTGETEGCAPELLLPDCPAVAAETCQPCLTGCVDFFLCLEAGWTVVAYCTEDGEIVVEP